MGLSTVKFSFRHYADNHEGKQFCTLVTSTVRRMGPISCQYYPQNPSVSAYRRRSPRFRVAGSCEASLLSLSSGGTSVQSRLRRFVLQELTKFKFYLFFNYNPSKCVEYFISYENVRCFLTIGLRMCEVQPRYECLRPKNELLCSVTNGTSSNKV
jgi:hypothetical protein